MGLSKRWKSAVVVLLPAEADTLTVAEGDPPEELHCTLWFLGKAAESPVERRVLRSACQKASEAFAPVLCPVRAVSGLGSDDPQASVLLLAGCGPALIREWVETLVPGMPPSRFPNFTPHITQGYGTPLDDSFVGREILLDRIALWWEDEREVFPLGG